uniref:Uncharacterized 3.3 kDa protein in psbJ-trnE intergenic region n=1 Tax=Trieres chinensis TaxID=1514140 RepID=YCX6_TRICV|nr:ORF26a [Trieres chinensis]P49832.1 RecName: Full=Uncharacterized 3.3 kDa protein in psbJ-trnE intergenic region; AltName: Full=ORF26A [Trieres chinensis]CAA91714.1 ORF26a [Trieres chinensis]
MVWLVWKRSTISRKNKKFFKTIFKKN